MRFLEMRDALEERFKHVSNDILFPKHDIAYLVPCLFHNAQNQETFSYFVSKRKKIPSLGFSLFVGNIFTFLYIFRQC